MPLQAVLFDFDGTLADSYDAIAASVNHVRAVHHLPGLSVDVVRRLVGHGLTQLMAEVIPGGDPERDAEIYRLHHPTVMLTHTRLLPGVLESLEQLKVRNVKMAVCSNKPSRFTRRILIRLGIDPYFDVTVGPEDSGKPKPDPSMVHLALERLGVSGNDALFVGDMEVDVATARAANVAVWVVLTGSSDEETIKRAKPDRILHDMNEFIPTLFAGAPSKKSGQSG